MTPRTLLEPARLAGASVMRCQSDARLVDLTRAGNDRAFEAIVERYRRPILRYCGRLLPAAAVEDVVQQVFANAYSAIRRNDAELNLRPWLYRIAHNSSINSLRVRASLDEELRDEGPGTVSPPGGPGDPELATERREELRAVVASMKALPERQQSALVLRELEGRSYEEIAAELGLGVGAVRALLNRARTGVRAAATAVTPVGLLSRAATPGRGQSPIGERIAELTAATGAAGGAKVAAAVLATGALLGGVGPAALPAAGPGTGDARAAALEPHREARARPEPSPHSHRAGDRRAGSGARAGEASTAARHRRARRSGRSAGEGPSKAGSRAAAGASSSAGEQGRSASRGRPSFAGGQGARGSGDQVGGEHGGFDGEASSEREEGVSGGRGGDHSNRSADRGDSGGEDSGASERPDVKASAGDGPQQRSRSGSGSGSARRAGDDG